jgi:hypothetical protein
VLVFVGENEKGDYGRALSAKIGDSGAKDRIRITGWADTAVFRQYLAAADVGVQLRTLSRGETSAAVLDCMNYGLATIVNANGSMADLPDDGVIKMPDEFDDAELTAALEALWRDSGMRSRLGERAREIIGTVHAPRDCADQYAQAIESAYRNAVGQGPGLIRALARVTPAPADEDAWITLARAVAHAIVPRFPVRQLLVDVSALPQTGPQRPVGLGSYGRLQDILVEPPEGFRVEPVRRAPGGAYLYARTFTLAAMDCPVSVLQDEPAAFRAGDVLLVPGQAAGGDTGSYKDIAGLGVEVRYVE